MISLNEQEIYILKFLAISKTFSHKSFKNITYYIIKQIYNKKLHIYVNNETSNYIAQLILICVKHWYSHAGHAGLVAEQDPFI